MNSYEEFLQAITELYDQNKIDFNNYKLLKKELESIESEHEKQKSEYRNYFKMLESKIKNIVVSGGGLTENQVQNIVSNYVTSHKSELTGDKGDKGEKGERGDKGGKGDKGERREKGEQGIQGLQGIQGVKGTDGLTTQIRVNGTTYTQTNGLITLPDYPTSTGGSGSGTINTSNFITFNNSYISDCNLHYVNGFIKTNNYTANLPTGCLNHIVNSWGVLFCIMENSDHGTGTQIFFPVSGTYVGRIFTRSIEKLKMPDKAKTSKWVLLAIDSNYTSTTDVLQPTPGEMNKGGIDSE